MSAINAGICLICLRKNFLCSDLTSPLKSPKEAKAAFHLFGLTYKQWAEDHQVHRNSVNEVIGGRKKCVRGDAHAIAVLLRIKNGDINEFISTRKSSELIGSYKVAPTTQGEN